MIGKFFAAPLAQLLAGICAALLAFAVVQTVRIEGFLWIDGFKDTIEQKDEALGKAAKELRTAEMNLYACSGAVDRQNAAVSAAERAGVESTRRAEKALTDARRANERATEAVGRIRGRVPKNCETGREIMGAGL